MAYAAWILLKLIGIIVFIFVSNLSAFFIHAPWKNGGVRGINERQ